VNGTYIEDTLAHEHRVVDRVEESEQHVVAILFPRNLADMRLERLDDLRERDAV
jgi:hypothetical protein